MSDSQAYEEVTVAADGVTVTKRFEEDEFPVPAIAFEFESDRDESVTVTMSDTVPEGIEVEDLGFHPEYGSEYWTIDDDTITFERDLEAGASYTTVYGIRATGSDDVQQFLTEPTLEEVDPPLPEEEKEPEDVIPESDDDVVKDAISGDGEIPGLEDEGDDRDNEEVETLDLSDPNDSASTATAETTTDSETAESDDTGGGGEAAEAAEAAEIDADGSITATMAQEIRNKNVSGEDVKLLRRAFELAEQEGGSTRARLDQIQSDISDLRAYTTALEEFLDENGTGAELIEDFEAELDSFDQRLDSLQSNIQDNNEQVEAVSETVSGFDEEIDSLSEEVGAVSEEVGAVSEDVDDIGAEVDDVSADVEGVSEEVESVSSDLEEFESAIEDIESEIADLEEQVSDEDLGERLDDIEESIDDLQTWQEQIKETFGG